MYIKCMCIFCYDHRVYILSDRMDDDISIMLLINLNHTELSELIPKSSSCKHVTGKQIWRLSQFSHILHYFTWWLRGSRSSRTVIFSTERICRHVSMDTRVWSQVWQPALILGTYRGRINSCKLFSDFHIYPHPPQLICYMITNTYAQRWWWW